MSRESRRRFVPLPETLIDEAIRASERVGMPYLVLIERILETNLKIIKHKPTILKALVLADALDDLKRLGGLILPWGIAKTSIESVSESSFRELLREMERMSAWFGELSRVKRGSSPSEFETALSVMMPSAVVEVIQETDDVFKFVITFLDYSPRILQLAETIAMGLAKGYGLNVLEIKRGENTIGLRVTGFFEKE